ncbi:iron-containing alcohol dehydrogenase [Symmachiella macrocystis]|uniref:iron-containing alcohol dehydrogenase n=1 Tax=Symmachiella macrocystis TaxID=2527985 RepID=UPI001E533E98|nr:iron-containing alcohol dehydrogenase [Symmachiella macrocystis]
MNSLSYNLLTPAQICFGWGRRAEVGELARGLGQRAFVVVGSQTLCRNGMLAEIQQRLAAQDIKSIHVADISHEPEVADVDRLVEQLRQHQPAAGDFVMAVGGGAAIDLAKAAAAIVTNAAGDSVQDYLEGVGRGREIIAAPLPLLAMPTTAGTGSEATKNAVISSYDPPFKKSLRSDAMMPDIVLIDPELMVTVPATTTAYTGMDAITQCIESYISRRRQPIPQALAIEGLKRAVPAITAAVAHGDSRPAREAMAHAALLSGMALANSGLGMAHGVAAALGVHCRVPHGLACAVMLPVAMRTNRAVARDELEIIGRTIVDDALRGAAAVDAGIARIQEICDEVKIPQTLTEIGVSAEQIPEIVKSSRGNSMNGNPLELSDAELTQILEGML